MKPISLAITTLILERSRLPVAESRLGASERGFSAGVSRFTRRVSRFARPVSRFTRPVSRFTRPVSRFTHRASRFTRPVGRFPSTIGPLPGRGMPLVRCIGRFLRYTTAMPCFIGDLVERSGVAPRTLREWVRRGLLRPPKGHGLAAEYPDENIARAVAVARMRAGGAQLDTIARRTKRWSASRFEAFVAASEPSQDAPAPGTDVPAVDSPAFESSGRLPPAGGDGTPPSDKPIRASDAASLQGPRWIVRTLLPGLVFMVSDDAPPLVRRIAGEIFDRYGTTGR